MRLHLWRWHCPTREGSGSSPVSRKAGQAHSRCSRDGRLTPGSQWPGECTLPPTHTTRRNARAAHTVSQGASASNDTHSHNKEPCLRWATSPRRHRHTQGARSPPVPRRCPPTTFGSRPPRAQLRRKPRRSRAGARGARGDAASSRDLKGSEGRRDPCRPSARIPPPRGREATAPSALSKFAFCPSAAGSTQRGTRFFPVFLRLPRPPPPASPVKATEAAGVARDGVVSLRPAEGTPFRVLPPFPGGVRTAHRGRRRVCGAGGEALGL